MKNKYIDLVDQTFEFPQDEFRVEGGELYFHDIDLMNIVKQYGTPLRITYLPKISSQIQLAKEYFSNAMKKVNYKGNYHYCYCTKSSQFAFIVREALKNDIHLETSSAYDLDLIESLEEEGSIDKNIIIVCNGFKRPQYIENIASMANDGWENIIPVLDNMNEFKDLEKLITKPINLGVRIASEEEPNFDFYTSRLGIRYSDIVPFYKKIIAKNKNFRLKMLHFFINTGIRDNSYYWNELAKCVTVYCELKKICPELDSLNIGGGLPIKTSLAASFEYEYMIEEIVNQIKAACTAHNVPEPDIYSEFGSFTVGEAGANIFKVLDVKQQNDRERWYMVDNSFMTTMPDTWGLNQRFILLPVNKWNDQYQRVFLGGLTCDSKDYYNAEAHANAIFLPTIKNRNEELYIGFFHTGAYQEAISGFGGIKHCLQPSPRHIIIDKDENGEIHSEIFSEEQTYESMLKLLGYNVPLKKPMK